MKSKTVGIIGSISTFFGGIGVAVTNLGLCTCVLAPVFSLLGLTSILLAFLSDFSIVFLSAGIALLISSIILHNQSNTCRVHKK